MSVHSTVTYVEPNAYVGRFDTTKEDSSIGYEGENWAADNVYERAPRLEDYCISLDIEVELSSRDTQGTKDVVILRWNSNDNETVSFLGGTKIGGYNYSEDSPKSGNKLNSPNYLTTYYSDLYVGDLIDYGTTEMIGIKSVDVQYEKSCVPIITIKFTDVRGYSLFQPTELNRTSTYQGIKGLSADNVAQSFFQCFFKLPLPRFTMYIKGFYGKPVAYVTICDKFDTNFNSETGDYDIDTRFIGFTYSFLTDISFTALMAAPYSDFVGRDHWEQAVNDGRFVLPDKYNTENKPMPTLYEIYYEFCKITQQSTEDASDDSDDEDEDEDDENENNDENGSRGNGSSGSNSSGGVSSESDSSGSDSTKKLRKNREVDDNENVINANTKTEQKVYVNDNEDAKTSKQKRTVYKENKKSEFTTQNDHELEKKKRKIEILQNVRDACRRWYRMLFEQLKNSYGPELCFDFKNGDDWDRIILLTSKDSNKNLAKDYENFSYAFKNVNKKLYNLCEDLMKTQDYFSPPIGITLDFSIYKKEQIFNPCIQNKETKKYSLNDKPFAEGILDELKNEITNRFLSDDKTKQATLKAIYNDGDSQRIYGYIIYLNYSHILSQLEELGVSSSNDGINSVLSDDNENEKLMALMSWYPSVENFMKILMAHVETYMSILYGVQGDTLNRTPEQMGVELGDEGNVSDVNNNSQILPPFPRITKQEMGDDGIVSVVDEWVGNLSGERFIEEDAVNGLLNGVQRINEEIQIMEKQIEGAISSSKEYKLRVKFPLTSFDFFLTKNPYGTETDVIEDKYAFAGKVAMRMFDILCINNYRRTNTNWLNKAKALGQLEAYNFFYSGIVFKGNTLSLLSDTELTAENIIKWVKGKENKSINYPWGKGQLFDSNFWLKKYITNQGHYIYPRQNMSFKRLEESVTKFKDSIDANNTDIFVWTSDKLSSNDIKKVIETKKKNIFGDVYIIDDFKLIEEELKDVPTEANVEIDDKDTNLYDIFKYELNVLANGGNNFSTDTYASLFTESDILHSTEKDDEGKDKKIDNFSTLADDVSEGGEIKSCYIYTCNDIFRGGGLSLLVNNLEAYARLINSLSDFNYDERIIGIFLLGFKEAIKIKDVLKYVNEGTFSYVPRLIVLCLGFWFGIESKFPDLPFSNQNMKDFIKSIFKDFNNLNNLSPITKACFIRYFKRWCNKYKSFLLGRKNGEVIGNGGIIGNENLIIKTDDYEEYDQKFDDDIKRANKIEKGSPYSPEGEMAYVIINTPIETKKLLWHYRNPTENEFKEKDKIVKLTTMLFSPVLIAKGNVNYFNERGSKKFHIKNDDHAISYLNGFLQVLRKLCGMDVDEHGNVDDTAFAESSSTEDMKKELYRYLKLVYDKWIPTSQMEEWDFETFFDSDKEEIIREQGSNGHMFHFIDSFYNKVGQKLLVNPTGIYEVVRDALEARNTNTMLFGFISDILAKNKTMLLCLQNFADLSKKESMEMMFRPLAYNSLMDVRKHPDFVVVYPYEPSKYLNSDNSEFKDDSFMLNDETFTPLAITSRGGNEDSYYNLPAFGVSYGKQYQSYFKKINVGMKNPIATQQTLIAKQALLNGSRDSAKVAVAQDVYDIYATQSYTCTVEMMGCAWVQPLMYFVLTNVPLFRGSYLIMKVTHQITPGNMVTQFTGARMANIANTFARDIFTDEEYYGGSGEVSARNKLAYIDNDCPYKIYSIYGDDENVGNFKPSGDEIENGKKIMRDLIQLKFHKKQAAAIVGNMYVESMRTFRTDIIGDGGRSGGLCQWRDGRLIDLINGKTENLGYNQTPTKKVYKTESALKEALKKVSYNHQLNYIKLEMKEGNGYIAKQLSFEKFNKMDSSTIDALTYEFMKKFENPNPSPKINQIENRQNFANKIYKAYEKGSSRVANSDNDNKSSESSKPTNEDITEGFLNAVRKTIASTGRDIPIKKDETFKGDKNTIKIVSDGNSKDNGLDFVFDIILNGYYDYMQKLSWVIKGNDFVSKPSSIVVTVSDKPNPTKRRVTIYREGHQTEDEKKYFSTKIDNQELIHKSLRLSLIKCYINNDSKTSKLKKDAPQFGNVFLIKADKITDCDTLVSEYPSGKGGNVVNGKIGNWDVGKSVTWLINHSYEKDDYHHICAFAVQQAIIAGGIECPSGSGYKKALNLQKTGNWSLVKQGSITERELKGFSPQIGDVLGTTNGSSMDADGHACMYCGNKYGWVSDCKQYSKAYVHARSGTGKFWVVRYKGSGPTTNKAPQLCYNGKCLKK